MCGREGFLWCPIVDCVTSAYVSLVAHLACEGVLVIVFELTCVFGESSTFRGGL